MSTLAGVQQFMICNNTISLYLELTRVETFLKTSTEWEMVSTFRPFSSQMRTIPCRGHNYARLTHIVFTETITLCIPHILLL
jgi:hypothetical protein